MVVEEAAGEEEEVVTAINRSVAIFLIPLALGLCKVVAFIPERAGVCAFAHKIRGDARVGLKTGGERACHFMSSPRRKDGAIKKKKKELEGRGRVSRLPVTAFRRGIFHGYSCSEIGKMILQYYTFFIAVFSRSNVRCAVMS